MQCAWVGQAPALQSAGVGASWVTATLAQVWVPNPQMAWEPWGDGESNYWLCVEPDICVESLSA